MCGRRQLGLRLLKQQVSTASSFLLICNVRSGALETKPSYGLAHCGDQQNADNNGYGVSSGLHRPSETSKVVARAAGCPALRTRHARVVSAADMVVAHRRCRETTPVASTCGAPPKHSTGRAPETLRPRQAAARPLRCRVWRSACAAVPPTRRP